MLQLLKANISYFHLSLSLSLYIFYCFTCKSIELLVNCSYILQLLIYELIIDKT